MPPNRKRKAPQCAVCLGSVPQPGVDYYELGCWHHWCGDCLRRSLARAVELKPFQPIRCCTGEHPVDVLECAAAAAADSDARRHVEPYLVKLEEFACQDKLYCWVRTCSAFIPAAARSRRVGTCPACRARTCKACKARSHFGVCPARPRHEAEAEERVMDLARKRNWRRCPRCSLMVERTGGCPHMKCVCECNFCYSCGETPWTSTHHCVAQEHGLPGGAAVQPPAEARDPPEAETQPGPRAQVVQLARPALGAWNGGRRRRRALEEVLDELSR